MSDDRDIFRVFPFELPIGAAHIRWSCPLDCGWSYDEDPYAYPCRVALPRVPEECTQEEIAAAVAASSEKASSARIAALKTLFGEHLEAEHPDLSVQDLLDQRARQNVTNRIRSHRPTAEHEAALAQAAAESGLREIIDQEQGEPQ